MPDGGLDGWVLACHAMLKSGGLLTMIHRADALPDVLAALSRRFGALAVKPVHPRVDAPASRILVRGRKDSRAPLTILPGLVLHDAEGRFTPQADAIHRGLEAISLDP
jgi:tRNA1(Val) A37 N6-methylase TrmN6